MGMKAFCIIRNLCFVLTFKLVKYRCSALKVFKSIKFYGTHLTKILFKMNCLKCLQMKAIFNFTEKTKKEWKQLVLIGKKCAYVINY